MGNYSLYNNEDLVITFSHQYTSLGDSYRNIEIINKDLLPVRLKYNCNKLYLEDWINRRVIPVNRHHMLAVLNKINLKQPFDLMRYSHGLSLNDTFWIKEQSENITFKDINLYDNKFDIALGWIAFTGLHSDISRNLSTPELTTAGVLPKYWQRIGNRIVLCKGGTSGYSNAGMEPYREAIAYVIANNMGIQSIPYTLALRNKNIVSISDLFTNKETGLITISEYLDNKYPTIRTKSLNYLLEAFNEDKIDIYPFYEMCLFDYIIENFDRHQSNWGLSIDNRTQKIIGLARLWDNGMSLDYDKPLDMRERFNFASFNIRYDFIFECEYLEKFKSIIRKLLIKIRNGEIKNQIDEQIDKYHKDRDLTQNTIKFVEQKCEDFLSEQ